MKYQGIRTLGYANLLVVSKLEVAGPRVEPADLPNGSYDVSKAL